MYLGEITRNILLSFIDAAPRPLLFNGRSSSVLNTHYGLDTAVLSEIEAVWESGRKPQLEVKGVEGGKDPMENVKVPGVHTNGKTPVATAAHFLDIDRHSTEDQARLERIRAIIVQRLNMSDAAVTLRDAAIVRWACSLVANRAAKLSSCAVAAVLVQTGRAKLGGGVVPEEESVIIGVDGRYAPFIRVLSCRSRGQMC